MYDVDEDTLETNGIAFRLLRDAFLILADAYLAREGAAARALLHDMEQDTAQGLSHVRSEAQAHDLGIEPVAAAASRVLVVLRTAQGLSQDPSRTH